MGNKILLIAIILIIEIAVVVLRRHVPTKISGQINNTLSSDWTNSKNDLGKVKVAVLYENITDESPLGPQKSIGDIIQQLKETHVDLIFRGFWR